MNILKRSLILALARMSKRPVRDAVTDTAAPADPALAAKPSGRSDGKTPDPFTDLLLQHLLSQVEDLTDARTLLLAGETACSLKPRLEAEGYRVFTLAARAEDTHGADQLDFKLFDPPACAALKEKALSVLGPGYVTLSVGTEANIPLEHAADFLQTLFLLSERHLLVSIDTCPSVTGGRLGAPVLPVSTWQTLLEEAGLPCRRLDIDFRERHPGAASPAGEDFETGWISHHWHRTDPFRDGGGQRLQMLVASKTEDARISWTPETVSNRLDLSFVAHKHRTASDLQPDEVRFPRVVYNLAYTQDWPFLRSLMDFWPAGSLHVVIREAYVFEPYLQIIRQSLARAGVAFSVYDTVSAGKLAIGNLARDGHRVLITATEGANHYHSLSSARLTLAARMAGMRTLVMQHGVVTPPDLTTAADTFYTWSDAFEQIIASSCRADARRIVCGSPKILDALHAQADDAFEMRLGAWTRAYKHRVLIGSGLHWGALSISESDFQSWLDRTCNAFPDTLFILRPHQHDSSLYSRAGLPENSVLLDDIALAGLDWPVARLLRSVDLVISTVSTLLLDAVAADRPYCVFGAEAFKGDRNPVIRSLIKGSRNETGTLDVDTLSEILGNGGVLGSGEAAYLRQILAPSRTFIETFLQDIQTSPARADLVTLAGNEACEDSILSWADDFPFKKYVPRKFNAVSQRLQEYACASQTGDRTRT